jgi:ribosome biogenesis GTPase / thiamine phosphate phosphatase
MTSSWTDGTVAEASIRGRLKLQQRTGDRVVAGDYVRVDSQPDGSLTIEEVQPRRSQLVRRAPGHARRAKVIVANVDRVVIVFAAASPDPNARLVDRFLVIAEANQLDPLIVLNKTDLVDAAAVDAFLRPYRWPDTRLSGRVCPRPKGWTTCGDGSPAHAAW